MSVFYGVVNGDVVELPEGVHLNDGTQVQIRTLDDAVPTDQELDAEERFKLWLLETGLVSQLPAEPVADDLDDFEPIDVEGEPLSQQIIRERR